MKRMMLWLVLGATAVFGTPLVLAESQGQAQGATKTVNQSSQYEGIWEGYDGEWMHVSHQLMALAEAIPADKYSWRPGPWVRSVSEVLVHITQANFYLLSVTGPKMPADMESDQVEKTVTSKAAVIEDLRRSLEAVKEARARLKPGDLERKVAIQGKTVPVEGMYLRILVHDNEHMGQLVAYARMNGIVPPWSRTGGTGG